MQVSLGEVGACIAFTTDIINKGLERGYPNRDDVPRRRRRVRGGADGGARGRALAETARRFVEWVLGPEAQALLATRNRVPMRSDVHVQTAAAGARREAHRLQRREGRRNRRSSSICGARRPASDEERAPSMKATGGARALARDPITALVIIVVFSVLVLFVGYPLFEVARAVVTGPGGELTFEPLAALSLQRHFVQPIANSLLLGVLVAFAGTAIGLLFAFAALRADLPFRGVLKKVATLPIITPPFVIALSAILLFGRNGVVTRSMFLDVFGVNLYAAGFDILRARRPRLRRDPRLLPDGVSLARQRARLDRSVDRRGRALPRRGPK